MSDKYKTQFWQNGNHSIELWNSEIIKQKTNYLHNNPVKQGIVANQRIIYIVALKSLVKLRY